MFKKHNLSIIIVIFLILSITPATAVETSAAWNSNHGMGPEPHAIENNSNTGPKPGAIDYPYTGPKPNSIEFNSNTGPEPGFIEKLIGITPTFTDLEGFHKELKTGHSSGIENIIIPVATTVTGVITAVTLVIATGGLAAPLVAAVGTFWASVITGAAVGATSGFTTALTQGLLYKDNAGDIITNVMISTVTGAAIGAVTGALTELVPKAITKIKTWVNEKFYNTGRFPGTGQRLGGTSHPRTPGMSRPTNIIPKNQPAVLSGTNLATSPSQAIALPTGPAQIHTLPTSSICNEISGTTLNKGLQTATLTITQVQKEIITPTINTIINPAPVIVGVINPVIQTIRGIPLTELNRRFPENTPEVINWLNTRDENNFMNTPTTFDIQREDLNWIRTQIRQHYWGQALPGGVRTLANILEEQRDRTNQFTRIIQGTEQVDDYTFRDIAPQLIFNQINIIHNLRRITTDFILWISLYLYEMQLIELAGQWGMQLPPIQEWDIDVDNARTDPGYIQFIRDNLQLIDQLQYTTHLITERVNPSGPFAMTAHMMANKAVIKRLNELYQNIRVRFGNLVLQPQLLTGNHVNYRAALAYFDRMINNPDIGIIFRQATQQYIAITIGQPVIGHLIGDAELRQNLQYALTGANDAPSCINRCFTCDPPLCCGSCCLTVCNPTTKTCMSHIKYIVALFLGSIGAITTIQKVPGLYNDLKKLIFGENGDSQPKTTFMEGMGENRMDLVTHNTIPTIDIIYLTIFVLSIFLIIYGTIGLIKTCFGGNRHDRDNDREPGEETPLIKHPPSYV